MGLGIESDTSLSIWEFITKAYELLGETEQTIIQEVLYCNCDGNTCLDHLDYINEIDRRNRLYGLLFKL